MPFFPLRTLFFYQDNSMFVCFSSEQLHIYLWVFNTSCGLSLYCLANFLQIISLFGLSLYIYFVFNTSCGFCGFYIQICCVRGTLVRKIRSFVASHKPANKLCGKRCGLAADRERARLQCDVSLLVVVD